MQSLRTLLLVSLLGQTLAQHWDQDDVDMRARKKCDWLKAEMNSGKKDWLKKQHWYPKLAMSCGFESPAWQTYPKRQSFHSTGGVPAEPAVSIDLGQVAGAFGKHQGEGAEALNKALGWMKKAMSSQEGAELADHATSFAQEAGSAIEEGNDAELKMGLLKLLKSAHNVWEQHADPKMKMEAALLAKKAEQAAAQPSALKQGAMALAQGQEAALGEEGQQEFRNKAMSLMKAAMAKPEQEVFAPAPPPPSYGTANRDEGPQGHAGLMDFAKKGNLLQALQQAAAAGHGRGQTIHV